MSYPRTAMTRKKKQDNTSDNIQNIVNDTSVLEKKTSQKRARSKVEDDSSNKKPEIAELEDRLGLSIDYNEEENVITLTHNRPQLSVSSLRRRPLDADEFVAEGDEVPDYVFDAAAQLLPLINRCELYLIGRAFTPTIVEKLWEPTDDDSLHTYRDMEDCFIKTFDSDPWNLFIYSKAGRQAVTFGELTSGTFYLQCAAAEYVPNQNDPTGDPIKQPMKDVYERQMYRKVYFNGQVGQFPRITIGSYQVENPQTGKETTTQYDKYQYVANEELFASNHMVWPQRKVTIYLLGLNFIVNASTLYDDDLVNKAVEIKDNRSRNEQIIEIILPEQYSESVSPILDMPIKLEVDKTPVDLMNAYRYAYDSTRIVEWEEEDDWKKELKCWGGELHFRVEPEDYGPEDGEFSDTSLYICAKRASTRGNNPSEGHFETIYVSDYGGPYHDPQHKFIISGIDRNVDVYITSVRKNYTKKFIIMTDGNVIVSDLTQLNDYLRLYTDKQIELMNESDRIVVGYQNTIGFLSTSSEWPWNLKINIRPSIAQEVDGLRLKLIGRYNDKDGENENYINYIAYKANPKIGYDWDDSSSSIDNITGTVTHAYDFNHGDSSYIESYITYDVSIRRDALDESDERLIFYLAFETIPKFNSISLKLFAGYDPDKMKIRPDSRTTAFDSSDFIQIGTGDDALWSMQYTTQRADMDAENHLVFNIDASTLLDSNYSHIYISDNAATITNYTGIDSSVETKLAFNGRLYNNMSIYVRPLPSVTIVFHPINYSEELAVDEKFPLTYNEKSLKWGVESTWTSESRGDITFRVSRKDGSDTIYTHVLGTTNYNGNTFLTGRIAVRENSHADLTIHTGVGNPNPTVSPCDVSVEFLETFKIEAVIDCREVLSNWPDGVKLRIKDNEIKLSNGDVVIDTSIDDTTQKDITHYIFGDNDEEALFANTGTSKLEVVDTDGNNATLPFRRLHIIAQEPSDSYINLCDDKYEPKDINGSQITYSNDKSMNCYVEMFEATKYTLNYNCAVPSKLKIIAYQPPRDFNFMSSTIPEDPLQFGWERVCRSDSQEETWTPGNASTGANYTSNQLMPILCFRIMQPSEVEVEDEDKKHQKKLDFYNKLNVVVTAVNRKNTEEKLEDKFNHVFKLYSDDDKESWCFDFYPRMSINTLEAFKASNNGKYDFIITCTVNTDYDINNIYIKKIRYQKNEMLAIAGEQPGWVDETLDQNSEKIEGLIPGNRYTGNDGANIQVFADVKDIDLKSDGRKLSLKFCDTDLSSQLSEMYPDNIENPEKDDDTNTWRFDIKTSTDIWAEKTPSNQYYTSSSEYYLHLIYDDSNFLDALYTKTYKFRIQPVFTVWWSDERYYFNNDGEAIIYFFNHYTDVDNTHISDPSKHKEEPPMNFPEIEQVLDSSTWPDNCVVQPSGGTSDMNYIYLGTEDVDGNNAYKIKVTGGDGFRGTVTMTATVLNRTTSCSLLNAMTVSGIHFWVASPEGYMHGAMKFEESVMPPIEPPVGTSSAIDIYLAFADTSQLNIAEANITTPYSDTISIEKNTNGGIVTTDVDSHEYKEHWDLLIQAKVTKNLDTYNSNSEQPIYYTGMPIQFDLDIPGTGGGSGYSTSFNIPLGPVIALHGYTPNSSVPSHTDGSTLKPIANNKCISQTRGHEWYMDSDNKIKMTSNGNVNNTEQEHKWNVTWLFNDTNLEPSSPDTGYNRLFKYPNDGSPCIKIQHPASWTETDGSNHPSDYGTWLISIIDTTDPSTGAELNGTLIGTVTVTDVNSDSLPKYKRVYNYYPPKNTTISINNYVLGSYYVSRILDPESENPYKFVSCGASMDGLVLNPTTIEDYNYYYSNIEIYMNVQSDEGEELTIGYECADLDVKEYLKNRWYVGVSTSTLYRDTTPEGEQYTHVAVIGLNEPLMEVFSDKSPNNKVLYSGKKINTKLIVKQGETELLSKIIQITIGRFGDAIHDNVPIIMSGVPGSKYTFDAYGRFVLKTEDDVKLVEYPINNDGKDVHGEITFSDSSLGSIVSVSYDKKTYTVSIDSSAQYLACGSITSKITLQDSWYKCIEDGQSKIDIRFEKYLNFYREYSYSDSVSYVLADCTDYFYCKSDSYYITDRVEYKHQFSKSYVPAFSKEMYYMTFRVTTIVYNNETYALIERITNEKFDGVPTAMFWGLNSKYGVLEPLVKTDSNFDSLEDIKNVGYAWYGKCTLIENVSYSTQYNKLELQNGEIGRTSYDWNLGNGDLDYVLFTNLDDYPIWSNQWTAPSI